MSIPRLIDLDVMREVGSVHIGRLFSVRTLIPMDSKISIFTHAVRERIIQLSSSDTFKQIDQALIKNPFFKKECELDKLVLGDLANCQLKEDIYQCADVFAQKCLQLWNNSYAPPGFFRQIYNGITNFAQAHPWITVGLISSVIVGGVIVWLLSRRGGNTEAAIDSLQINQHTTAEAVQAFDTGSSNQQITEELSRRVEQGAVVLNETLAHTLGQEERITEIAMRTQSDW